LSVQHSSTARTLQRAVGWAGLKQVCFRLKVKFDRGRHLWHGSFLRRWHRRELPGTTTDQTWRGGGLPTGLSNQAIGREDSIRRPTIWRFTKVFIWREAGECSDRETQANQCRVARFGGECATGVIQPSLRAVWPTWSPAGLPLAGRSAQGLTT